MYEVDFSRIGGPMVWTVIFKNKTCTEILTPNNDYDEALEMARKVGDVYVILKGRHRDTARFV